MAWEQQSFNIKQYMRSLVVICLQPTEMFSVSGSEKFRLFSPSSISEADKLPFPLISQSECKNHCGADVSCQAGKKNRKTMAGKDSEGGQAVFAGRLERNFEKEKGVKKR